METIINYYSGIVLAIFILAFVLKNIITSKRTHLSVKGKSVKVNLMILISALSYTAVVIAIVSDAEFFASMDFLCILPIKITGLIFITAALFIGIGTLVAMSDSWRVGIRPEQKTELVTKGLFWFSRNPYFLSYIILFLGYFLLFPSVVLLLLCIMLFIVIHLMVLDEEKYLAEKHGGSYLSYKNKVRRYLNIRII